MAWQWKIDNYDIDDHDYSTEQRWTLRLNGLPLSQVNGYPIRYFKYKGQTYFIDSANLLSPVTLMDFNNFMTLPNLNGFTDEE